MKKIETKLPGVYIIEPQVFGDQRGYFMETWSTRNFEEMGLHYDFVQMIQKRQSIVISAPEEIAYVNGWIDKTELMVSAERYGKSPYGAHLKAVAEGKVRY